VKHHEIWRQSQRDASQLHCWQNFPAKNRRAKGGNAVLMRNKRDLSISMDRANLIVLFTSIPVAIAQFVIFRLVHGGQKTEITWGFTGLILLVLLGVLVHEFIHGISWMIFGHKPFSAIKFGFQWKTFTPYAHLKEPVEVNAYRLGAFMPGFLLGILI
jgi:hypothetical protein